MERALRKFAIAFFFAFPIVFGPFVVPFLLPLVILFGFGILGHLSAFEGSRLVFLVFWAVVLSAWTLAAKWREFEWKKPRAETYAVLAFAAPFWMSSFANPGFPVVEAAKGETYSVLPFLSTFLIALSVSAFPPDGKTGSLKALVLGFVCANFPYAVIQRLGLDPLADTFILPWQDGRAYGTFWNPNSLSFFAVLSLPLAFSLFRKGVPRYALIAALFSICVLSGSWSGIAVFLGYLSYRYFGFLKTSVAALAVVVAFFAFSQHFQDKRMSVWTRVAIVGDAALRSVSNPRTFLLWDGASAVEEWFSAHRSAEVTNFVDPRTPIDRSHFLFFDLSLVFWTPFALASFAALFFLSRKTERPVREALSVFLVLSCLHTPDSAHLLFVSLLLVSGRSVPKKPLPSAWTA